MARRQLDMNAEVTPPSRRQRVSVVDDDDDFASALPPFGADTRRGRVYSDDETVSGDEEEEDILATPMFQGTAVFRPRAVPVPTGLRDKLMELKRKKVRPEINTTCAICLDKYERPVTLIGCGHVFCEQCVCDLGVTSQGGREGLKCPTCRKLAPDFQHCFF